MIEENIENIEDDILKDEVLKGEVIKEEVIKDEGNLNFKELKVWNRAVEWVRDVILMVEKLQTERKHFRLIEQLESAVTSVSMNISEGKGRYSKKEFIHFLYIASGSAYETITLLNIFESLNWISKETLTKFENEGTEIVRMINRMVRKIGYSS